VPQHDPIVLAKTVASIDHLTGDRLCEAAGVRRAMMWLPSAGIDRLQREMDAFEAALADVRGE
jgi:alkanesulfonate monooxygenase SsuD/methylene tetrahydromethanopterin reductase-like flavin-dependent oxidoreductase (luciferase family)